MRIPWYIVAILALTVFFSVLWFGARGTDFTQAPSDTEIANSLQAWKTKHPSLPPRQRALPTPTEPEEKISAVVEIPQIPVGDLITHPALDHYSKHRDLGSESFVLLAQQLEKQGQHSFALLAWERILDTVDASPQELALAFNSILALRSVQPNWNTDSNDNFDLVLHIQVPEAWKAPVSAILTTLTIELKEASSYLVAPQVLIKTLPHRPGFPAPPVRVWLSNTGKVTKQTPLFSFHSKADSVADEATIKEQLYLAIFRTISAQMESLEDIMPLAEVRPQDSSSTALTTHITRLHWKKLIDSLTVDPPKRAAIIVEE